MTVAFAVLRVTTVRERARQGRPVHSPWRYVLSSPLVWVGVGLIAIAVNKIAGDIVITVWMVAALWISGGSPSAESSACVVHRRLFEASVIRVHGSGSRAMSTVP